MILSNIVTVFCVDIFGLVLAESYSNAYFQPLYATNGVPVDVVNLGTPGVFQSSQTQQASLTLPSILPDANLVAYRPVNNAKLIAYRLPYQPLNDGYAYATFDDGTGNTNSQNGISNERKVLGYYPLPQTDANVEYTADDVKGFKAFVTDFLWKKLIDAFVKNDTTEKSAPLIVDPALVASQEKVSNGEQIQESSSSNNTLDTEVQLAEVKEIKPPQPDPAPDTPVKAAVEEIKSIEPKEPIAPIAPIEPSEPKKPSEPAFNGLTNNIINCIQTAMKNSESPLVYIIVPSKPCS